MNIYHYLTIINSNADGRETHSRKQVATRSGYRLNVKDNKHSQIETIVEEEVSLDRENSGSGEYVLLHTAPLYRVDYEYGKPQYSSKEMQSEVEEFEILCQRLADLKEYSSDYHYKYCYLLDKNDKIMLQIELEYDSDTKTGGVSVNELNDILVYINEVIENNKQNGTMQTISEIIEQIIEEKFIVNSTTYEVPIVILNGHNNKINVNNLRQIAKLLEKSTKYKDYREKKQPVVEEQQMPIQFN